MRPAFYIMALLAITLANLLFFSLSTTAQAAQGVQAVQAVQTMARRMDLLTAVTRLLLENSTFSESLTLQRCARLLAGEFASWVIVDVVRGRRLRRQFAVGPAGGESESIARAVRATRPMPATWSRR